MSQLACVLAETTQLVRKNRLAFGFWIFLGIVICILVQFHPAGWDLRVYNTAIHSLKAGRDPYADTIAVQRAYHNQVGPHPSGDPPYSYVYSPLTLPLLCLIGHLPIWLSGCLYWLVYTVGILGSLLFAIRLTQQNERRAVLFLAPVSIFFPGLLACDSVLSGNIAFILYPAVLLCAAVGWHRGNWRWFYVVVLAASCVKAPLLSLVAIPVLSARRQWIPASLTAVGGVALFAAQSLVWPPLFRNYLQAVDLQFLYNRDFGCSPAGLLSDMLYAHGIPYSPAGMIVYLCYAMPLGALLWRLARRFHAGEFPLAEWIPVLFVGVVLLNPRIMEYDVAALTLLMGLIIWRFFARFTSTSKASVYIAILFAVANAIAADGWYVRKLIDGPLLVVVFSAGCWMLLNPVGSYAEYSTSEMTAA